MAGYFVSKQVPLILSSNAYRRGLHASQVKKTLTKATRGQITRCTDNAPEDICLGLTDGKETHDTHDCPDRNPLPLSDDKAQEEEADAGLRSCSHDQGE
jgi:hypothetical protein